MENMEAVNDLLGIVQNLDNEEEAKTFIHLYVKAMNNVLTDIGADNLLDETDIIILIGEIDFRLK